MGAIGRFLDRVLRRDKPDNRSAGERAHEVADRADQQADRVDIGVGTGIGHLQELRSQRAGYVAKQQEWEDSATTALRRNDEAAARHAVGKAARWQEKAQELDAQIEHAQKIVDNARERADDVRDDADHALGRAKQIGARERIIDAVEGSQVENGDTQGKLDDIEGDVLDRELIANAREELDAGDRAIEEIERMTDEDAILERLKGRLGDAESTAPAGSEWKIA